jgi:hypothetical protein
MATDVEAIVGRSMKAVQGAHEALRSLRTIPLALTATRSALDKLLNNLDSLATSPEALAMSRAFHTFSVTMRAGISLSDALVLDMEAIAKHLRFMTPSDSEVIVGDLSDQECQDIAEIVDCYNRSVSSVLIQHSVCVRRVDALLAVTYKS